MRCVFQMVLFGMFVVVIFVILGCEFGGIVVGMSMDVEFGFVFFIEGGYVVGMCVNMNMQVLVFMGIFYVVLLVGDFCWKLFQFVVFWEGMIYEVVILGLVCMQVFYFEGLVYWCLFEEINEDCFYFNVWMLVGFVDEMLLVMVWIYGGVLMCGFGLIDIYDGINLVVNQDVVVVIVNY